MADLNDIDVIAPNLKRRLSGVTATILRLVPVQARDIAIRATGPGLPSDVPHIPLWRLPFLSRKKTRIWHARRNTEMLLGLLMRVVFRMNLKLIFTSAAQRKHTGFTKSLIAKMDGLIATSPQAASFLDHDAEVILHGVDTELFTPAQDRAALRHALGLPEGLLIGCSGRIRYQKGQDLLIASACEILPKFPDAKIAITGRATPDNLDYQNGLMEQLAKAGLTERVIFMGEIAWDQVISFYQCLDLFVAPARWEGFGLTPLEAMACGTPAIACRGVGAFEAQIKEGETGYLIEKDNAQALTDALSKCLKAPKKLSAMRPKARAHVCEAFAITREAAQINAVYERVLKG